jgi:hypothetical protein
VTINNTDDITSGASPLSVQSKSVDQVAENQPSLTIREWFMAIMVLVVVLAIPAGIVRTIWMNMYDCGTAQAHFAEAERELEKSIRDAGEPGNKGDYIMAWAFTVNQEKAHMDEVCRAK